MHQYTRRRGGETWISMWGWTLHAILWIIGLGGIVGIQARNPHGEIEQERRTAAIRFGDGGMLTRHAEARPTETQPHALGRYTVTRRSDALRCLARGSLSR